MRVIHKKDLVTDRVIPYSYISPIIGSFFIFPWGAALIYFYKEIPLFVLAINVLLYPIFFTILMKQFKQCFFSDKFLLAFKGSDIIFSMNHGIKSPDDDKNYFLSLTPGEDFSLLRITKGYKVIKSERRGKNKVKNYHFIRFSLKSEVALEIKELHESIATANGFSGSPVEIKNREIIYHIEGNFFQAKKIARELIKRGLFSGKFSKLNSRRL